MRKTQSLIIVASTLAAIILLLHGTAIELFKMPESDHHYHHLRATAITATAGTTTPSQRRLQITTAAEYTNSFSNKYNDTTIKGINGENKGVK